MANEKFVIGSTGQVRPIEEEEITSKTAYETEPVYTGKPLLELGPTGEPIKRLKITGEEIGEEFAIPEKPVEPIEEPEELIVETSEEAEEAITEDEEKLSSIETQKETIRAQIEEKKGKVAESEAQLEEKKAEEEITFEEEEALKEEEYYIHYRTSEGKTGVWGPAISKSAAEATMKANLEGGSYETAAVVNRERAEELQGIISPGATTEEIEITQVQKEVDDYDKQLDDISSTLDSFRATVSANSQALISFIQRQYDARREQMKDINHRAQAVIRTLSIRAGTSRYAPLVATGIVATEERAGVMRLAALDAEEARLISEARAAATDKEYEILHDKMELIERNRDRKNQELLNLQALSLVKSEEIEKKNEQMIRDTAIVNALSQGYTDPAQIFGFVNFDENGNRIGNVSMGEIMDIIKDLPAEKKEEKETINNIPYRIIRDKVGNIMRYEKIPGVEKPDRELTFNELKAYNAAGANLQLGATVDDARATGILIGEVRSRSDLSSYERIAAGQLATSIFGKRRAMDWVPLIEDLMAGGMTIDEISDNLRYETVSPEFQGIFKSSFEFVTKSDITTADRIASREYLDELLEEGDIASSVSFILSLARDKGTGKQRDAVLGREEALAALDEIEEMLHEYINKGGSTGLLSGKWEKFQEGILGRTGDPELARIGNEIAMTIQRYRQQLTGAAFTESEAREYRSLFPGIDRVPELNQALIDSMRDAYNRNQEQYYKHTLGVDNYNALLNTLNTVVGGVVQPAGSDPLGITGGGQQAEQDPLNIGL